MFALLRPAMQCPESTSLPKYRTKTRYAQHGAVAKIKRATSFFNERSGTQFHHDWKPMQSIIDILHKNFQRTIQIQGDFQDYLPVLLAKFEIAKNKQHINKFTYKIHGQ